MPEPSAVSHVDTPRAWLTVAAAFLVGFVVFGIAYSFGAFLAPMTAGLGVSQTSVSALSSVSSLLFYSAGPFAGHLGDRFGPRPMVAAGAVIFAAGLGLTGLIGSIGVGYLTYGIGVAGGLACVYAPSLATVGVCFVRHRNTALGIAASGTGCGTLVLPPLAATLIEAHGWRTAFIAMAGICGVLLLAAAALVQAPPPRAVTTRRLGDIVRSRPFLLLYASWVSATTALLIAIMFLPAFAQRLGVDPVAASGLVSVIGGVSIVGRAGIGAFDRWVGTLRLFRFAVVTMAGSYVFWWAADGYGALLVFAAVLGLGYGIRIALMPAVLIEFFGLSNLGSLLGAFFTASGVAAFIGPLAAGAMVDITGGFAAVIVLCGALGWLGVAVLIPLRRP